MASSPTEALVQEIAGAYESALVALGSTDLETVQARLDRVDQLMSKLQEQQPLGVVDPKWKRRVEELHTQLCTVIEGAKARMSSQLQRAGQGRRALKGYGGKGSATGRYYRSEG